MGFRFHCIQIKRIQVGTCPEKGGGLNLVMHMEQTRLEAGRGGVVVGVAVVVGFFFP